MKKLFSERHGQVKPRVSETLDETTRNALLTLLAARIDEEWFGMSFPDKCGDGYAYAGTDFTKLRETMKGYGLLWPADIDRQNPPDDGHIFDLLEFSYEFIAEAKDPSYHSYMSHSHYSYDRDAGREKFAYDVNRIFERNGMTFELVHGEVIRIAPAALHESLASTVFNTGDKVLDELLEVSRHKFLHHALAVRRESLEKLWDAWERLKTVEAGKDKKATAKALLDKAAAEPNFRSRLEQEARELTEIGNTFMIRHTETDKVPIVDSAQVDYLFHRMFSIIRLLLKQSGRGG
jgi:AbiJ N-terminal domain 4